ncbi:uncharacterized protein LOC141848767 [Brevipalpus obovatus]|uniref:uncharacterized protein LOC141848767 n=1 Tax=Brevipalpus obovatus TaxID=246614 RepID=UPI003D9E140A
MVEMANKREKKSPKPPKPTNKMSTPLNKTLIGMVHESPSSSSSGEESSQNEGIPQIGGEIELASNSQRSNSPNSHGHRLPDRPVESVPITAAGPRVETGVGDYPARDILRRGYAWDAHEKKYKLANLVDHEPLIYHDEELDCPELEPKEYGYIDSSQYMWAYRAPFELDSAAKRRRAIRGPNPERPCRFCHQTKARKDSCDRHEKICTAPGGPKHVCDSACPTNCVGPQPWVPSIGKPKGRKKGPTTYPPPRRPFNPPSPPPSPPRGRRGPPPPPAAGTFLA